jgi:hypothetical protein
MPYPGSIIAEDYNKRVKKKHKIVCYEVNMKNGMKQAIKQTTIQQTKLEHELSMKLMMSGQAILEIEDRYLHCLSRDMQEKVHEAAKLLRELADECMTDMTRQRMLEWEKEKNAYTIVRRKESWENNTPEQQVQWREYTRRKCAQGFLDDWVKKRNA